MRGTFMRGTLGSDRGGDRGPDDTRAVWAGRASRRGDAFDLACDGRVGGCGGAFDFAYDVHAHGCAALHETSHLSPRGSMSPPQTRSRALRERYRQPCRAVDWMSGRDGPSLPHWYHADPWCASLRAGPAGS